MEAQKNPVFPSRLTEKHGAKPNEVTPTGIEPVLPP